jgi:ABC-2 type transport system permease protein
MSDQSTRGISTNLYGLAVLVLVIVVINLLSGTFYRRLDLTKEKKYTLSQTSEDLADQLEDVVYFRVFLEGDFPSEYRRLQRSIRDMLNEFRRVSSRNIQFQFEDVLGDEEVDRKEEILRQLASKGLQITQPEVDVDETVGEKYIIPGALVSFQDQEYPLNFFKREFGKPLEEEINGSIELLEYEIANILRKCLAQREVKIGFTEGHGELEVMEVADAVRSLEEYYTVHRVNLNLLDTGATRPYWTAMARDTQNSGAILFNGILNDLMQYEALVVAKPLVRFLDQELLLIDQYIMRGGKVIWLVDRMIAEMDSLKQTGSFAAIDRDLNLDEMLFRYGVRVNPDLVQDLNCHGIPVISRRGGSRPGFQPWIFYPLLAPRGEHPIVRNLTSQWGRFMSSVDTLASSARKTVLLQTSENSRLGLNPVEVSMSILNTPLPPEVFRKKNIPVAVLLEGTFVSPFAKRRAVKRNVPIQLKDEVRDNAMIVIGDGDFIRNQVNREGGEIYPLGYDRYASRTFNQPVQFANKKFFLNCVDYLCDDSGIIEIRSKEVVLRLLDKVRVKTERRKWQMLNMVVPVVAILLFGLVNTFYRRRRYVR